MTYAYSMDDAVQVANQAATDIEAWLWSKSETISVVNVEDDPKFQHRDIDLIWTTQTGEILIEIKGDRWNKTRNLFFETHSNLEKGTPVRLYVHRGGLAVLLLCQHSPTVQATDAKNAGVVFDYHAAVSGALDYNASGE